MADGTVDNLNIQLSADANKAVQSLNSLKSALNSINTAFSKDISGMRKFSKEIGTLSASMRSLSNIKFSFPDLSGMNKMLKSLKGIDASKAKNAADGIEKVVNSFNKLGNANFNDSGINKTVNALNRLFKVDMSKFNPNDFEKITNAISKLGNMPDVSSGISRFVSALSRLANAGEKTKQSASGILRLGNETAEAARRLQSVGGINDDVNLFVQSIGRLASAGAKASQTASGLGVLAKETISFFNAMAKAPKISQNTIQMVQALAQLASAGGKVGTSINSITSAMEKLSSVSEKVSSVVHKVSGKIVSAFDKIRGSTQGLTLSFGNLLSTAIGFQAFYGLINFGKQAFQLGSDITEVENVVDVAFGGMAQSAYDFAKTAQEQFGLSELSALRYSGILMSMFNASGIAQRDAAEMSTTLTGLAGDLASFYNIDQDDAFTKLRSALAGEVEPMRALGVDMTVASMEAYALSQGITESWQSMSQAEKVMLRYNYLMSVTAAQQGDFQRTQASFANQTRLLTLNIQQLAATIGQGLISAVLPAVTALNKLFTVLQKAAVAVRNFFYVLTGYKGGGSSGIVNDLAGVGDAASGVEDLGSAGSDAAGGLEDADKAAKKLNRTLFGFDEMNVLNAPTEDSGTGGTGGTGDAGGTGGLGGGDFGLDDGLLDLGDKDPEKYVSPWAERIRAAFLAEDWELLGEEIAWGLNKGLQKVYDVISWDNVGPKIESFTRKFTRTFNSLVDSFDWDLLGRTAGAGINTVANTINGFVERINWSNIGNAFSEGINGAVSEINWANIGRTIGNGLMIPWKMLLSAATNLDFGQVGRSLATGLNNAIAAIDLGTVGQAIAKTFSGIVKMFGEFSRNADWAAVGQEIASGINNFLDNFSFSDLVNTINDIVDGIRKALWNAIKKIKWGDIFNEITDAIGNIELDSLAAIFVVAIPQVTKFKKALDDIPLDKLINGFKKFTNLFKGNFFKNLATGVKNLVSQMSNLQKAAVGAVAVFAQFSLSKDAFKDLASGGDNVVQSLVKIAAGAATTATALKLMGLSNPFTAIITGATTLISALVGINNAVIEQKEQLAEQKELELYGETVADITQKTNESTEALKRRIEESQKYVETAGVGETAMAQNLSDRYFDLAEKERKTNEEKEEMRRISQRLIEQFPELEEYYNTQSGLIDTTRENLQKLIDERLREIQLNAVEEQLTGLYEERVSVLKDLSELSEDVNAGYDELLDLENKYNEASNKEKLLSDYESLREEILNTSGDTSDLQDKLKELEEQLTNNGTEEIPTFATLREETSKAYDELESFRESYGDVVKSFQIKEDDLESIDSSISYFSGMLSSGMKGAGNDAGKGYAEGLGEAETDIKEASKKAALVSQDAVREANDSHSPSIVYKKIGKDAIDGYILGMRSGLGEVVLLAKNIADSISSQFRVTLVTKMSKTASEIPNYFKAAWSSIQNVFKNVPNFFWTQFSSAYKKLTSAFQPISSFFSQKWASIKNTFSPAPSTFRNIFQSAYSNAVNPWNPFVTFFSQKWSSVQSVFNNVNTFFRNGFQTAYNSVTQIWSGLSDFFRRLAQNSFSPMQKMINGIIKGVNWILKEVDSGTRISEWGGVKFAKGTSGLKQNTVGVVNDQKGSVYREMIVPPNGKAFIPKGRNVMLPLQKGTKIMPANQTKEFMKNFSKIPHFADGVGSLFVWNTRYSGDMMDYLNRPDKATKIGLDRNTDVSDISGIWRKMVKGIVKTSFDGISDFVKEEFEKVVPKVDYNPSAGVEQWRSLAKYALKLEGQYTIANLNRMLMQMKTESGGNPRAINLWDSNAKRGTPSKGLMQVIDPTFRANARPGYSSNIYDPLSNMLAAIRYTVKRYGSLAKGWKGHGYAEGIGKISFSDIFKNVPKLSAGGIVGNGQIFVANEKGPELLGRYGKRTAVMNNDQIVGSVSDGVADGVYRAVLDAMSQTGGAGGDLNITVQVGSEKLTRQIVKDYNRIKKSDPNFGFVY